MHKLLSEVIEKGLLEGKRTKNVMGDRGGFTLDENDPEVQRLRQEADRLIPDTLEFDQLKTSWSSTIGKPLEARKPEPRSLDG